MGKPNRRRNRVKKQTGGFVTKRRKRVNQRPRTKLPFNSEQAREKWDKRKSLKDNYASIGITLDPNVKLAKLEKQLRREKKQIPIDDPVPEDFASTQQLKELLAVPEPGPPREENLGVRERWYVKRLHDKYGEDYKRMARDVRLNPSQYTAKQCKNKIQVYLTRYKELLDKEVAEGKTGYTIKLNSLPEQIKQQKRKQREMKQKKEEEEKMLADDMDDDDE